MLFLSVEDFLEKASACRPLSREEERLCAEGLRQGDPGAAEALRKSYLPMNAWRIRRLPEQYRTLSLVYACLQALDAAIHRFDFSQTGETFIHHFSWCLRQCTTAHIADTRCILSTEGDAMQDFENLTERQTDSQEIFNGAIVHLFKDTVALPNGHKATREVIRHVGAVAVVPLLEDGRVIVERQFRYPLNMVITEIPAGKLDSGTEDRLAAAKRELREETGYTATEWTELGDFHPTAAYCDEKITLYLARGLTAGERELDEDEFLNVRAVPLEELVADILAGRITDGKTQTAILKAHYLLNK